MEIVALFWSPLAGKLLLSAVLGLLIGIEREMAGKDPGLRTYTLISLGSCIFTTLSVSSAYGVPNAEPSRIAAQIIPGIGFLGAGAIFQSTRKVSGLTTAALMWVAAAIGMAVGFDRTDVAILGEVITLGAVFVLKLIHKILPSEKSGGFAAGRELD